MPVNPETGEWYPNLPAARKEAKKPKRRSLKDYQKEYDFEKGQYHPWVHYVKAIPMGEDGQVPMNHSLEVLNNMAIHLERLGFEEPNPDKREIKYVEPEFGPQVVWNPGEWVDIDTVVPEGRRTSAPERIDLSGVPDEALASLRKAFKNEEIRRAKVAGADAPIREEIAAEAGVTDIQDTIERLTTNTGDEAAEGGPTTP